MGHPVLREQARALTAAEIASEWLTDLLEDMSDTLADAGGIGLAAPQIGESVRVTIISIPAAPTRYGELESMPLTVFINPVITVLNAATEGYWEGCLSVPDLRGYVERPQHIQLDYADVEGSAGKLELDGFAATVAQHEIDHLDGRLYLDRITDMRLVSYEPEFERYIAPQFEL